MPGNFHCNLICGNSHKAFRRRNRATSATSRELPARWAADAAARSLEGVVDHSEGTKTEDSISRSPLNTEATSHQVAVFGESRPITTANHAITTGRPAVARIRLHDLVAWPSSTGAQCRSSSYSVQHNARAHGTRRCQSKMAIERDLSQSGRMASVDQTDAAPARFGPMAIRRGGGRRVSRHAARVGERSPDSICAAWPWQSEAGSWCC